MRKLLPHLDPDQADLLEASILGSLRKAISCWRRPIFSVPCARFRIAIHHTPVALGSWEYIPRFMALAMPHIDQNLLDGYYVRRSADHLLGALTLRDASGQLTSRIYGAPAYATLTLRHPGPTPTQHTYGLRLLVDQGEPADAAMDHDVQGRTTCHASPPFPT